LKIGVIADSHDHLPPLRRAVQMLVRHKVEAIIHVGDFIAPFAAKLIAPPNVPESIPVHCCYGNNDGERAGLKRVLPQVVDGPVKLTLGGKKVVFHHFIDWLKPADINAADIVISGHTHEIVNEKRDGKLILNPGECCGWVNDKCTVAILETDTLDVRIIEITV